MKKNLKTSILIPFISFLGVQTGFSQELDLANSMLWTVVDTKTPQDTSYLFGTIHQISQKDFTLKDKLVNALYKSDVLLTEMDLSNPSLALALRTFMHMEDGMTLDKLLSKKDYSTLNSFMLEGIGESIDKYNKNKPFITSTAILKYYIDGTPASYDMVLTQMAVADSMKIIALETLEQQMTVMDKMSYKDQANYLMELVNNSQETRVRFQNILNAYKEERLQELNILLDENLHSKEERQFLVNDRNKTWLPVIQAAMMENNAMVAVGAGHLGGEMGLINLLRKKGFEVKPVFDKEQE